MFTSMGNGAFRDASAALERAAILEADNQALQEELVALRSEVGALRGALEHARATDRTDDEDGVRALRKERDTLLRETRELQREAREVDRLRTQLAAEHAHLSELRHERNRMSARLQESADAKAEVDAKLESLRKELRDVQRVEKKKVDDVLESLRKELREARRDADQARADADVPVVAPNRDAYTQRVKEERDELLAEVRKLREAATRLPRPSFLASLFGRK